MSITIVGGGNPSGPTFPVQRSVRLRSSASAYFERTVSVAGNRRTWTWSGWVKRGTLGVSQRLFNAYSTNENNTTEVGFDATNNIIFSNVISGSQATGFYGQTSAVFRDPSAWYHIVFSVDTTQSTAAAALKVYVNGVQQTLGTSSYGGGANQNTWINAALPHRIGQTAPPNNAFFDGYLTEINFIDGQALTPASFGAYNSYGVWSPAKYTGTYGTNGFYLNFQDNSAATAAAIGKDSSGNGNNWTPNNISVTAGVTYDSMLDVPTLTSANNANFATLNPTDSYAAGLSQGNLNFANGAGLVYQAFSTIANPDITANKFYCEVTVDTGYGVCIAVDTKSGSNSATTRTGVLSYYANGQKYNDTTGTAYGATFTAGDIIGIAMGNGQLEFFKNGVSQGVAFSSLTGAYKFGVWAAGAAGTGCSFNFGQRPFTYTPPTEFKALNTYNLPTPTIANGAEQFAATLYTGNGAATQTITNTVNGKSFQPDFVWIKDRSVARNNDLMDSVRGASKGLFSNLTNAEVTASYLSSFNSNGFTTGNDVSTNGSGETFVGWQWKASNATGVTNTAGSITSTVSANPTAGFSIVTYTGNGTAGATVGHGLGIAPKMFIIKSRSGVRNWQTYHASIGNTGALYLNTTNATVTASTNWNNTSPTSSVISLGTDGNVNANTETYVAYCFSEIAGYSKFGSYTGNGSADGPFVYLGFRPRWIMWKRTDTTGSWYLYDTSRSTYNASVAELYPNLSNAEANSATGIDILSNGWKIRTSGASDPQVNASGGTYIYAAFAENPFNYSLAR